ncbi:MAG TPA: outer membrane beta-barrel protein [Ignavibacteria bacterium]
MKKLILTVFLIIAVLSTANAQISKFGGGLTLSSGFPFDRQSGAANKSGVIALSLKHIHEIKGPFQISPTFTFFYPHITKNQLDKTTVSSMMFDTNFEYVFNYLDRFEFYGLAGPDLLIAWKKYAYEGSATYKEKSSAWGLNLGVGTYVKITKQFYIYGEAKYVFSNKYNQFILNTGVLLDIDWMKKHENSDI